MLHRGIKREENQTTLSDKLCLQVLFTLRALLSFWLQGKLLCLVQTRLSLGPFTILAGLRV